MRSRKVHYRQRIEYILSIPAHDIEDIRMFAAAVFIEAKD